MSLRNWSVRDFFRNWWSFWSRKHWEPMLSMLAEIEQLWCILNIEMPSLNKYFSTTLLLRLHCFHFLVLNATMRSAKQTSKALISMLCDVWSIFDCFILIQRATQNATYCAFWIRISLPTFRQLLLFLIANEFWDICFYICKFDWTFHERCATYNIFLMKLMRINSKCLCVCAVPVIYWKLVLRPSFFIYSNMLSIYYTIWFPMLNILAI